MVPQAIYSSLTHGWMSHWTYLSRTCPDVGPLLHPLEDTLHSLTSQAAPNNTFRDLFALPCHHGGLGLPKPGLLSTRQYQNSLSVCGPMVELVVSNILRLFMTLASQVHIRASIHSWIISFLKSNQILLGLASHPNSNDCLTLPMKRVSLLGWLLSLLVIMALISIKELFGMLCAYAMVGNLYHCLLHALVVLLFRLNTVLTVIRVVLLSFVTMIFAI